MHDAWHIRPARPEDLDVVVRFNVALAAESERTRLDPQRIRAGVASLLADPHRGRYLLAARGTPDDPGGAIVGQLMHTYEWSDWRNGWIWWLQSVYVVPECRRTGAFRALLERLRTEAAAREDVVGLRLYVEQENHDAHRTYERFGFAPAGYLVMQHFFRADLTTSLDAPD